MGEKAVRVDLAGMGEANASYRSRSLISSSRRRGEGGEEEAAGNEEERCSGFGGGSPRGTQKSDNPDQINKSPAKNASSLLRRHKLESSEVDRWGQDGPFLTLRDGQSRGRQIRLDAHQSLRNSPSPSTDAILHPASALSALLNH